MARSKKQGGCLSSIIFVGACIWGVSWLVSSGNRPTAPVAPAPIPAAADPGPAQADAAAVVRRAPDPEKSSEPPAPASDDLTVERRQEIYASRLALDVVVKREVDRRFPAKNAPARDRLNEIRAWSDMRKSAHRRLLLAGVEAIGIKYRIDGKTLERVVGEGKREGWQFDEATLAAKALPIPEPKGYSPEYEASLRGAALANRAAFRRKYGSSAGSQAMEDMMDRFLREMMLQDMASQARGGFSGYGAGGSGGHLCGAPTQSGAPCRNPVRADAFYCYLHGG